MNKLLSLILSGNALRSLEQQLHLLDTKKSFQYPLPENKKIKELYSLRRILL